MTLPYFFSLLEVFPYFLLALFLSCFIPGNLFLKKIKLGNLQHFVLSMGLGIVLWGWQGYLFGYLHIRWMSYIYLLVFLLLWIRSTKFSFKIPYQKAASPLLKNKLYVLIIVIGMFIQLTSVWFVGVKSNNGFYSCCGDARDNLLQIAITKSIVASVPPKEPGITGADLKNYHYWSGLVNGELVRVFHLPLIPTEYQYMTIILSLLLGLSLIAFGLSLRASPSFIRWLLFFIYLGGDAVFFVVLFFTHHLSFGMSSMEDGSKFLVNYPRAFAVVLFFISLISFVEMLKQKKNWQLNLITSILIGSLVSFKVYIGIFAMIGYFTYISLEVLKKDYRIIIYGLLAVILSSLMYFPANAGAGGLYFTGMWRFENYIVQPGFHAIRLELARLIYARGHKWMQVSFYELLFFLFFTVGTFGTKLLGIIQNKKSFKAFPKELHFFLLSGILVSGVAGFFFEQASGGANSFNFLVSIFIIGSIYTALTGAYVVGGLPRALKIIVIVIIILITVPRVIVETGLNLNRIITHQGFIIPSSQLTFLTHLPLYIDTHNNVILVDHNNSFNMDHETPYVYVFTGGNMYLSGVGDEIDSHNISAQEQKNVVNILLNASNPCNVGNTLLHSPIEYIISDRPSYFYSTQAATFVSPIYKDGKDVLYKINSQGIKSFLLHIKNDRHDPDCSVRSAFTERFNL